MIKKFQNQNKSQNQGNKNSHAGAIVAGIAGITATAIGAYYLYGHKDADKNRAKVKSWMLKAKGEVLEDLEKVKTVTGPIYMKAVDMVARKYSELKNIDAQELEMFVKDMRDYWSRINGATTKAQGVQKVPKTKKTGR